MAENEAKAGRGQFKCFKCRGIFPMKEGNWHHWQSMEVHLCKNCEKLTREQAERKNE